MVAVCLIIAGIVGVATRNSTRKGGTLTAAGFYLVAALFGGILAGNYTDLYFWSLWPGPLPRFLYCRWLMTMLSGKKAAGGSRPG